MNSINVVLVFFRTSPSLIHGMTSERLPAGPFFFSKGQCKSERTHERARKLPSARRRNLAASFRVSRLVPEGKRPYHGFVRHFDE